MSEEQNQEVEKNQERFEHKVETEKAFDAGKGLKEETVRNISEDKDEPEWMTKRRLKAFRHFKKRPMPDWGPDLSELDFEEISHYIRPDTEQSDDWEEVPDEIEETFDKLGIPEAEKEALSGVGAQFESQVVYQNMKEEWEEKGVIFCDMDKAVQEHPELVKEYFMTKCVPAQDNKFAALHGAVWSGGSFVYVPEGVEVEIPVQAYFRMNQKGMGQFEHTLIIAEENSTVHYIEGCSAPQYTQSNLHAGCVEVFVGEGAHVQYSTVQNWSKNTYNLNTKRAKVSGEGTMEWVSGSMGSKVTMLYPSSHLNGEGAKANHITIAYAGDGQNIDTGAKVIHNAPNTSSTIESKSISQGSGRTNYRGLVRIPKGSSGSKTSIECDALMFDEEATSDTEPYIEIKEDDVEMAHEATVGRIGDEEIHYMMSRGIEEEEAKEMIVRGFIEPIAKELPLEYAVELNRLITLEMEGSLG
jgi:Fe-S cluster assembly protein SufB